LKVGVVDFQLISLGQGTKRDIKWANTLQPPSRERRKNWQQNWQLLCCTQLAAQFEI